jgi:hypothetical protein
MAATEPLSGSKNSSLTLLQSPRSRMVNRPLGFGNFDAFLRRTASSTGR